MEIFLCHTHSDDRLDRTGFSSFTSFNWPVGVVKLGPWLSKVNGAVAMLKINGESELYTIKTCNSEQIYLTIARHSLWTRHVQDCHHTHENILALFVWNFIQIGLHSWRDKMLVSDELWYLSTWWGFSTCWCFFGREPIVPCSRRPISHPSWVRCRDHLSYLLQFNTILSSSFLISFCFFSS